MAKGKKSAAKESPTDGKRKVGKFKVKFQVVVTSESFNANNISIKTTVTELKDIAELTTGIPTNIQRLHYLDEGDLADLDTLQKYDAVPGARFKLNVWSEWSSLVETVAAGDIEQLFRLGVTIDSTYKTPNSEHMTAEGRQQWLSTRAFIALYIACHRGHDAICQRLIQSGVDVNRKTVSGRCPLHIAAIMGHDRIISSLIEAGADIKATDADGLTAVQLAKKYGHKTCENQLIRSAFQSRAKSNRVSEHPLFAHQVFDSSLKASFQGEYAQFYCQQLLPPGEFEGTGLNAPKRRVKLPGSKLGRKQMPQSDGADESTDIKIVSSKDSELANDLSMHIVDPLSENGEAGNNLASFREWLAITEGQRSRSGKGDRRYNGGALICGSISDEPLHETKVTTTTAAGLQRQRDMETTRKQSATEKQSTFPKLKSVQRDIMDAVIEKKLQEQEAYGVRGLPYDLWLTIGDHTELYKAVRDRGELDTMMRYHDNNS